MAKPVKKKPDPDGKAYLAVLFPGEQVDIGEGESVTVRPLSLENLKDVVESFQRVISYYREGNDAATIVFKAFKEVMELLPFCIDRPMNEIPSGAAPDLLEAFLRQNLADEVLGKWTALVQTMVGELQKRVPDMIPAVNQSVTKEGSDTK
jgi:hypothetical protein